MRVLLGMSGGFDSTVSAKKLIDSGHTVEGALLVMHEYTDVNSARHAAEALGIPLHIIDVQKLFDEVVKTDFVSAYKNARTPNPCVICNEKVKFLSLYNYAMENGFDRIATGHYAKITTYVDGGVEHIALARPRDRKKDQTYMLYRLPEKILKVLMLPLADEVKEELRQGGVPSELREFDRPDSQEICFLPNGDYRDYLTDKLGPPKFGNFIDDVGNIIAPHKGITHYTIGQRKGLGISFGERVFVTDINPESGNITLSKCPKESSKIYVEDVVLTSLTKIGECTLRLYAKVRYQAPLIPAVARFFEDDTAIVELEVPARSVAPGQSLVLYDGDVMVAGGIISR